jgi:hypothetical protein
MDRRTKEETITPKVAISYLETMVNNRVVTQPLIDSLASQINAGLWCCTHQGIAFDIEGRLVDGQHRMWACVAADKPIRVMVTRGLTPEEVLALDCGRNRSSADMAHYDGVVADPMVWAVAKPLLRGILATNIAVPFPILKGWYEHYKDGIDFAIEMRGLCRPARRTLTAPMMTATTRAFYGVKDRMLLRRFFDVAHTGQRGYDADSGATVFREAWIAGRLVGRRDQYFKMCAAIRAFVDRRPIRTLQSAEIEVWALPKMPNDLRFVSVQYANNPKAGTKARAAVTERAAQI